MTDFHVDGKIRGKARPRFANGHTYTPAETKAYEQEIATAYRMAGGKLAPKGEAVGIDIICYFKMPDSWSKNKKNTAIHGHAQKKPDIDNVIKIVLDGLNGVAYEDDSQVAKVYSEKFWADDEKIVVVVKGV